MQSKRSSLFRAAFFGTVLTGVTSGIVVASATQVFADQLVVPKAKCGPHDHPETALQGQVSAALRAAPGGFLGFSCNLELVSQRKNDGANWQSSEWRERGDGVGRGDDEDDDHWGRGDDKDHGRPKRVCAYHTSAAPNAGAPNPPLPRNPAHYGVPVNDITDPKKVVTTGFLQTTSMLDPWESLKVNERRQLLGADNGANGGGGPEIDIYDVSLDCRFPQLLASTKVGTGTDGGFVHKVTGHEGSWAPDGLTYYGGDLGAGQYYAVDTSDPRRPKLITAWHTPITTALTHGLSISADGKRGYFASLGFGGGSAPSATADNGLLIYDLSQIQARVPNPQVTLISTLLWKDGSGAQHTIPIKIDGKPYLIFVDEAGSFGFSSATQQANACAAGMPPFPMARIIDISDEKNPRIVSRLGLETHDPKNCAQVLPDLVGLGIFTYGSHYCSVDNKKHTTTLACGYFNSGIRVFDIRNPERPKEIAYFNPRSVINAGAPDFASPGSNHVSTGQWKAGGPDWCTAQVHLNAKDGTLWSTCQDNGLLVLKFTNGVWPFPGTTTPPSGGEN
jgi:hypothetical protein